MIYHFRIHLSAERFLPYYRGQVRNIVVRCENGQRVQFPARFLIPHLGHGGVSGRFALICDEKSKVVRIDRA